MGTTYKDLDLTTLVVDSTLVTMTVALALTLVIGMMILTIADWITNGRH